MIEKGGEEMSEEKKDFLNEKLGMAEIQGRFVNLDELSVEEIDKMLKEAKENEKRIRKQINDILNENKTNTMKKAKTIMEEYGE